MQSTAITLAHVTSDKERNSAFREGVAAGETAVKLQPQRPEGHFWLGANLGGRAKVVGGFGALSLANKVQHEMETVLKLDEGYQSGSAYMALAQIKLETPALLGGDRKAAVELLEKGLRFGKTNTFLRLRLAEAYLAVRRTDDARKQLQAILAMKPDPGYEPEFKESSLEARRLLDTRFHS